MNKRIFVIAVAAALSLCSCSYYQSDTNDNANDNVCIASQSAAQTQSSSPQQVQTPQSDQSVRSTEQTAADTSSSQQGTYSQSSQTQSTDDDHNAAEAADEQVHSQADMYEYHTDDMPVRPPYMLRSSSSGQSTRLSLDVKIDLISSGMRDKQAEQQAQAKAEAEEKMRRQRLDTELKERADYESNITGSTDTNAPAAVSSTGTAQSVTVTVPEDKPYPRVFTAVNSSELKGYLSYYFEKSVVDKYCAAYNDAFFKNNVLLLDTIEKKAGDTTIPEYVTAVGDSSKKIITADLHSKKLSSPLTANASVLIVSPTSKTTYESYAKAGVNWRLDVLPYYPLAKAKLDQVGWDIKSAFNASYMIPYYGHTADMPQDDKHTTEWYANYGFTFRKGNCYVMAAMFCEMARMLGYQCTQISGKVPLINGTKGDHSWCEIIVNGEMFVCDPNFSNETPYSGYMRHYGEKFTWKYIKVSVVK